MPASEIRHHVRWDFAVDCEIVRLRVFKFVYFAEFAEPIRPGGWNVAIDGCRARKGGSRVFVLGIEIGTWMTTYLSAYPKVSLGFGVAGCQDSKMLWWPTTGQKGERCVAACNGTGLAAAWRVRAGNLARSPHSWHPIALNSFRHRATFLSPLPQNPLHPLAHLSHQLDQGPCPTSSPLRRRPSASENARLLSWSTFCPDPGMHSSPATEAPHFAHFWLLTVTVTAGNGKLRLLKPPSPIFGGGG